jgi:hypothetical protein
LEEWAYYVAGSAGVISILLYNSLKRVEGGGVTYVVCPTMVTILPLFVLVPLTKIFPSVPTEYFCELDQMGRRLDQDEKPELSLGCVEFIAPSEYMVCLTCFCFVNHILLYSLSFLITTNVTSINHCPHKGSSPNASHLLLCHRCVIL